jgi:3'-5' exoribonuclease
MTIVQLGKMAHEEEGDLFALLTAKEELKTRDGKPYWRVCFRDRYREVVFPIWDNTPLAAECRERWVPGTFYKIRAVFRETSFGPQLDIRRIRETTDADRADGFEPKMCLPRSRFDPEKMFSDLVDLAERKIDTEPLRGTVLAILATHRDQFIDAPAARRHHHAFTSGLLEHTLSVTQTCIFLTERYTAKYPDMLPPLDLNLVVAGAILHDIGKLLELEQETTDASYTPAGAMIGHLLLGRDMVRSMAFQTGLNGETLLRLEHLIIAHQRLPEWGSPRPPMTPEALIVHYVDELDAKYDMLYNILQNDKSPGPLTSDKNLLKHRVFRGLGEKQMASPNSG